MNGLDSAIPTLHRLVSAHPSPDSVHAARQHLIDLTGWVGSDSTLAPLSGQVRHARYLTDSITDLYDEPEHRQHKKAIAALWMDLRTDLIEIKSSLIDLTVSPSDVDAQTSLTALREFLAVQEVPDDLDESSRAAYLRALSDIERVLTLPA